MIKIPDWQTDDGRIQLYCGDCLKILPHIGKVDAVITDPPYGISYSHGKGGGCLAKSTIFNGVKIVGDDKSFDPSVLLNFPVVVLWGANHYASKLPNSPSWLIWDKRRGVCSNDQADCEMAWSNIGGPARLKQHLWNGMLKDSERGTPRVHPTQKPIEIMKWCIEMAGTPQTICDPFMGSGTTGVACIRTGRKFVGIEISEDYFKISVERIKKELEQQLFSF
jgi:site-specific DNA-methyltransferase (adenine-specific)/modification methylase